jgi:hypothetical protein
MSTVKGNSRRVSMLYPLNEAAKLLGGISIWTLRKHIAVGNTKVTRIGRRVFLTTEEVERIGRDGLPSLAISPSRDVVAKT